MSSLGRPEHLLHLLHPQPIRVRYPVRTSQRVVGLQHCGFADLSWGGSADNVDPWSVLEYEIYEDDIFLTVDAGEVVEGAFGRHTYLVKAVDRSGNTSGPSNAITLDHGLSC